MTRFFLPALVLLLLVACQGRATIAEPVSEAAETPPAESYHLAACYPHDPGAFTQGLFWLDGHLYESTGQYGESSLRKVRLEDGAVLQSIDLPGDLFGEGIVNWDDEILGVTWRSGRGFRWSLDGFEQRGEFSYTGEGWGLTQDGEHILMSNGSDRIVFRDPESFAVEREIAVTFEGQPVGALNELEYADGAILANVWRTAFLIRIDPGSGRIERVFDLSPIAAAIYAQGVADVMNGVAHDPATGTLYVTGKYWPLLFELRPGTADPAAEPPCAALPTLRWSSDGTAGD